QVGTRFLCSDECTVHQNYKDAVVSAKDRDAVVTGRSTGHPVRTLKNKLTRTMDKLEKEGNLEELEVLGAGALRAAVVDGDVQMGSAMAGQSAGLIADIKSCEQIVKDLFNGVVY
ncbi:MAG: nitronate monooxygenase, partial [Clostridia bacterium]|nr:nitronate monooxygenase [Clostridia bacterium]